MTEKKRNYIAYDEGVGLNLILGDIERTLEYIKLELEELKDSEVYTLDIKRHDMTKEEMEKAPVI